MAKFRYVNTAIWDDEWFVSLDPIEQHLFLYLLLNANTNMAGVYQLSLRRMAFETGLDQEKIKRIVERFAKDGKAFFVLGYIVMKNWLKNQTPNPKQWQAVVSTVNALPGWLRKRIHDPDDTLYIPYDTVSNGSIGYAPTQTQTLIRTLILNKTPPTPLGGKKGGPAKSAGQRQGGDDQIELGDEEDATWS